MPATEPIPDLAPMASGKPRRRVSPDLALALGLMVVAAALRIAYFSGYGLGDDANLLYFVRSIYREGFIPPDNIAYRFTWWLPTVLSCRVFGLTEPALILPSIVVDTLGIGLVYAFGRRLWGRSGGVVAALLLTAMPLDFTWATMMTNDLFVSFFTALALLCTLAALEAPGARTRTALWAAAAASVWLAFHAKVNGPLILPVIAFAAWRRRQQLDRRAMVFVAVGLSLAAASMLVSYALAGDPIAPYHAEIAAQGLTKPDAPVFHRLTSQLFWTWIDTLFRPDFLGDLLFSVYPHALVLLAAVAPLLGLRTRPELVAWLLVFLLGMQVNSIQLAGDVWVAGFRNVRHAHAFVYPMVLILGGLLCGLRARAGRWVDLVLVALLAVSLWQCVSTASKMRIAFADRRAACRLLSTLPLRPVHSDFQILTWAKVLELKNEFPPLADLPELRAAEIPLLRSGYFVTGGAREPLYGCFTCIPLASELPSGRWRLLLEVTGPPPAEWRPEPLRVWEAVEGPPPANR
jgi:4-amino-4-deoxy-L-arabinose transferase-like glycosyltransferase